MLFYPTKDIVPATDELYSPNYITLDTSTHTYATELVTRDVEGSDAFHHLGDHIYIHTPK